MNNSKDKWLYKPCKVSGVTAEEGTPSWYGATVLGDEAGLAELALDIAKETGMSVYQVLHVIEKTDTALIAKLQAGRNVRMSLVGFNINMNGSLPTADADFDPKRNALTVSAYALPPLRDCLAGIVPANTVQHLMAYLGSVMDSVAMEEGVITVAERVIGAGRNIKIGPNPDELCRLLAQNGEVAAVPEVLANDSGTIDLSFAESFQSIEDGEYVLEIRARNGASTDMAPAVARRAVTVRKAS